MRMLVLSALLLLLATFNVADSYKILVYNNLFGHSHIKFLAAVADTLTEAGHDVTVLMPVIDVAQRNRTVLKNLSIKQIFIEADDEVVEIYGQTSKFLANLWTAETKNPIEMYMNPAPIVPLFAKQCDKVMKSKDILEQLKAEEFDLAIAEPFDSCSYGVIEYLKIPAHVSVLSCARMDHASDVIGQLIAPSYVPSTQSVYSDRMTMYERLMNFLQFQYGRNLFATIGDIEAANAKKLLGIERTWREILPESSFLLTNHIPILEFPAPTLDKIIPIGGLSVNTDKKSMKLEHYFDTMVSMRKKNVIISFGSVIQSKDMPVELKKSMVEMMGYMSDVTFIWKYEDLADKKHFCGVLNLNRIEWIPQNELLADSRVDAFITHGGLASVTELAMMGKPAVVIPIFADQGRNAEMLKRHGGVEILQKTDLSNAKLLARTLRKVMENKKYRQNAEKLAEQMNNMPTDPKKTLVSHVEFAAKFGKLPHMDPYGRHQNFFEYYLLDIISIATVVILTITYTFVKICFCMFRRCCGSRKVKFE
ncbi:Protein CBR-UGT-23 [Caenorhabditis briggsae]|uniref:UDP-glucuronosyltransferase n=1 Tax=Caenorhabditis briggsae TaxID=6238 RepID=A8WRP2_CAEBR|nr:Protein CBR-UGT-23 [Caenorhabditis briggsae]CAP23150.1 Protein CBR-UGT-23 [Caenorhabditis briggsae]